MTLLMQCNSTRLDSAREKRRDRETPRERQGLLDNYDGGAECALPNSCPLGIQPLCGRVAGCPYITYVDPDQDHSAPFMYETPAYNARLSFVLSLSLNSKLVGGGFELDWSPTVFSNYPSFRTRFSPVSADAYKYIC